MTTARKIRTVVVDDEALARQVLREFLGAHPEIEIVAECANGFEAVKATTELEPELLFLDIQMPKLDGFEVLELLGTDPVVVFVTAFDNYAIKAFEVHAVDYLLKPYGADRFEAALGRAKERLSAKRSGRATAGESGTGTDEDAKAAGAAQASPQQKAAELAAAARPPAQYLERIPVRDGTRVFIIPIAKLDYIEAQDDYVALCSEGKKQLKQQTISSLEVALDPSRFMRIHRSYIVNVERVTRVEPYAKDSHVAVLANGAQIPVSRAGYSRLRAFLDR